MSPSAPLLSRRQLLVGGSAATAAVLLGACGGDDDTGGASKETDRSTTTALEGLALVQFFGGPMFVPGPVRLPFGVADVDGLLTTDASPAELEVAVLDADGGAVGGPIVVRRHAEGLPRPYYPLRAEVPAAGFYTVRTEIDGIGSELSFEVNEPGELQVVGAGDPLPSVATPTAADPAGVDPICTSEPVCPLHELTLTEALGEGRPVALLVSTPAFCELAICGPVLDVLLSVADQHPEVRFLHTEVYAHPYENQQDYAPIVAELGLHFEPCLLLAGSDGRIVERLDTIFDAAEASERLALLA
ncbi:MAG: twin-arginine translocation signal domain-containing protein [Actinomycetota bacterium]